MVCLRQLHGNAVVIFPPSLVPRASLSIADGQNLGCAFLIGGNIEEARGRRDRGTDRLQRPTVLQPSQGTLLRAHLLQFLAKCHLSRLRLSPFSTFILNLVCKNQIEF